MELTREIVLAEPPGKRLDSWIAEKVMGWKIRRTTVLAYGSNPLATFRTLYTVTDGRGLDWSPTYDLDGVGLSRYSTDIAAAFEAEAKALESDPAMYVHCLATVVFGYNRVQDISDIRKMCMLIHATPEQRSKAALLALEGGEGE